MSSSLDPVLAGLLAAGPLVHDMRVTDLATVRAPAPDPVGDELTKVTALSATGCDGWLYLPRQQAPTSVVVVVHGGGWAVGSPEHVDGLARTVSRTLGAAVVNVRYRLAPEFPAPAAFEDVVLAVRTIRAQLGLQELPLALVGDSAGANLCAAASIALRDERGRMPNAQLLLYPAVDLRPRSRQSASWLADADPLLPAHNLAWCFDTYLGTSDAADPRVSPAAAPAESLPATVLVTVSNDPLHDQGVQYARALQAAGTPVVHLDEPALCHGFSGFAELVPAARIALDRAVGIVRDFLPSS